jgi:hypothetical protein
MLHWLGHVARIVLAMSRSIFEAVGFLFVDNTYVMTVAHSPSESTTQVASRMQAAVDAWHGGFWASGGALKPDKCSWCLVSFYWEEGQWFHATLASVPGTGSPWQPHHYNPPQSLRCHQGCGSNASLGRQHVGPDCDSSNKGGAMGQIDQGWMDTSQPCSPSSRYDDLAVPSLPSPCFQSY